MDCSFQEASFSIEAQKEMQSSHSEQAAVLLFICAFFFGGVRPHYFLKNIGENIPKNNLRLIS